jgi:hypothetical protein
MPRRHADSLIWTTTSVRIAQSLLRDLKIVAVEADTTVNRLILRISPKGGGNGTDEGCGRLRSQLV